MTTSTRTILAVNPSHATSIESGFWTELARCASSAGWRLVQLAWRRIPEIPDADTFVMPARLGDFHRWAPTAGRSVPWLSDDQIALHDEWEHRRWELPLHKPTIRTAVRQLAALVDDAITDIRPAVVLTTNKIDHPCAFARHAAQHHGAPVIGIAERSPFESIWFEPDGLFRESTIWDPSSPWRTTSAPAGSGAGLVDLLRGNPAGFRSSQASQVRADLVDARGPVVFLPFDNLLWTGWSPRGHPQGTVDYPILADPAEALEELASAVDEVGGTLVVKPHPSCVETSRLFVPPGVRMIDASLDSLLAAADVTVAFNTKLAFVSLAAGVPTVTLAENPAAAGGHTYHWSRYAAPIDALRAALERAATPSTGSVTEFFGQLEHGHFYAATNDGSARGPVELFGDLVDRVGSSAQPSDPTAAIGAFRSRFSAGRANGHTPRRPAPSTPGRPRVVLAADRLVQDHLQSSGIARYGWELLAGLEADERWEVYPLVREPNVGWHQSARPLFERLHRLVGDRLVTVAKTQREDVVRQAVGKLTARDVVHSIHMPLPMIRVTGSAARIVTIHDVLHLSKPELHVGKGRPSIEHIIKSIDPSIDHVICDSDHTRRDLLSLVPLPGERVATVHLGATCHAADPTVVDRLLPPHWNGFIVTMLQPEPRKNCSALLQAAASVFSGDRFDGIGLVAVGSVSAVRFYADDLREIDHGRVVVLPDLDDQDLHSLLGAALGFVYPSLYEGFGLPPLEAMAVGCPVVVVPNSSLVEVVGDAGIYAHGGTAEDLADAIHVLCSSPTMRASLSRRGRDRAAQLSWQRTVERTISIYDQLTSLTEAS